MPVPISNLSATFANSQQTFVGLGLNVSYTAAATGSRLFELKVNNEPKFWIGLNGVPSTNLSSLDTVARETANAAIITSAAANTAANIALYQANNINVNAFIIARSSNIKGNIYNTNILFSNSNSRRIESSSFIDVNTVTEPGTNIPFHQLRVSGDKPFKNYVVLGYHKIPDPSSPSLFYNPGVYFEYDDGSVSNSYYADGIFNLEDYYGINEYLYANYNYLKFGNKNLGGSIALKSPSDLSSTYELKLPYDQATDGQVLTGNSQGYLSWSAGGGIASATLDGANTISIAAFNRANTLNLYIANTLAGSGTTVRSSERNTINFVDDYSNTGISISARDNVTQIRTDITIANYDLIANQVPIGTVTDLTYDNTMLVRPYKKIEAYFDQVTFSTSAQLQANTSVSNGLGWNRLNISTLQNAGNTLYGLWSTDNASGVAGTSSRKFFSYRFWGFDGKSDASFMNNNVSISSNNSVGVSFHAGAPINWVKFTPSAGTFTGGFITLIGYY